MFFAVLDPLIVFIFFLSLCICDYFVFDFIVGYYCLCYLAYFLISTFGLFRLFVLLIQYDFRIIICFYCFCVDPRKTSEPFVEVNGDPNKE